MNDWKMVLYSLSLVVGDVIELMVLFMYVPSLGVDVHIELIGLYWDVPSSLSYSILFEYGSSLVDIPIWDVNTA
jgi:hypothetical protein